MVSSGDPGVYGMAGVVLEVAAKDKNPIPVEIVPGVTAATAASAILGAPLISDFAVISLSDLLTPLEKIERRLEAASSADMSIVLYNPQSQGRIEPLAKAYEIMMKHIKPDTPVGIVREAGREGQNYTITTLKNMLNEEIDMITTIVVGNSMTRMVNGKMVTARGYDV
jgi:precorrin-3B C17-methyltransferase